MKQLIQQSKIFLALYLVFFIAGGFIFFNMERGNEILYFSSLHTPFFDEFFKRITQIAELPMLVLILAIAIRFGYGTGLILTVNAGLALVINSILKKFIFASEIRPAIFFEAKHIPLNFVHGVEPLTKESFPSGHAAAAFALFFMLSILMKNKMWNILFFTMALLVAVSRVYLLQHFFRDVYFGSVIGMLVTTGFYLTFVQSKYYQNITWKDKVLLK